MSKLSGVLELTGVVVGCSRLWTGRGSWVPAARGRLGRRTWCWVPVEVVVRVVVQEREGVRGGRAEVGLSASLRT